MSHSDPTPCAHSKPVSDADEALTRLLACAREVFERYEGKEQAGFTEILPEGVNWLGLVTQDNTLTSLLDKLPQAFGSDLLLQCLCTRLFQVNPQPIAVSRLLENP